MPRFFVDRKELQAASCKLQEDERDALPEGGMTLRGDAFHHAQVLRLRVGESVTLCDGAGTDYYCKVSRIGKDDISLTVLSSAPGKGEPAVEARVYMALAKSDKLEHVIQKATELGAQEIIAFPSSRCVAKLEEKLLQKKLERWQKIAEAAAEQSGRGVIPLVRVLPGYEAMLEEARTCDLKVLFYENEESLTFRAAMEAKPFHSAALITGPEGGFSPEEVAHATEKGISICTLGKRILRCETAPLCALSALLYQAGEF